MISLLDGCLAIRTGNRGATHPARATVQTTAARRRVMGSYLKEIDMYIGGGLLGTILIVLLIVYLVRRV
jgi:hypothetical protein